MREECAELRNSRIDWLCRRDAESVGSCYCGKLVGPHTHDLTRRDYHFTPREGGRSGSLGGFNSELPSGCEGDFVLLRHPSGGSTRYRITKVGYHANQPDPPGQWFALVEFAPRGVV